MILIKIILFAFVIYYLIKTIGRFLLQPFVRNIEKNMGMQNPYKKKKEGEITIQYQTKKDKGFDKGIGEYIDFEEIKD